MKWLYRVNYRANAWYDRLDKDHGVARLFLAMVLIMTPATLVFTAPREHPGPQLILGVVILGILAISRVAYMAGNPRD